MLRVDDLCRFYARCIIASWQPGFSPKKAMPLDIKASLIISIGSEIGLPLVPSWLCNVLRNATVDWLTAQKCRPVGTEATIKGSPSPVPATQHQNFIATSPVAALIANIDCLRTDLFVLIREGVVMTPVMMMMVMMRYS